MKKIEFIKSQWLFFFLQLIIASYVSIFTYIISNSIENAILTLSLIIILDGIYLFILYHQKNKFYNSAKALLNSLEEIQYASIMLDEPSSFEEKIFYEYIQKLCSFLNKEINRYRTSEMEYSEFQEIWLHEIKIPIACLDLLCENEKNEITRKVKKENKRIYELIEQALYFSKVNYLEADIKIKECNLDEIINNCLKNNSYELIAAKTEIKKENTEITIFSDEKWLYFILNQIISNSLKYKKETLCLSFIGIKEDYQYTLLIKDNGIGICSEDLPRVFEKGFTGNNGHQKYKSTGIGLYLIQKMATKMNLFVSVDSKENEYTSIKIVFPVDSERKKVTNM